MSQALLLMSACQRSPAYGCAFVAYLCATASLEHRLLVVRLTLSSELKTTPSFRTLHCQLGLLSTGRAPMVVFEWVFQQGPVLCLHVNWSLWLPTVGCLLTVPVWCAGCVPLLYDLVLTAGEGQSGAVAGAMQRRGAFWRVHEVVASHHRGI